jgi:hypothetical protein
MLVWARLFAAVDRVGSRTDRSDSGRQIGRGNPASHNSTIRSFKFPVPV